MMIDNLPEKLRDEVSSAGGWLGAMMDVDEDLCTCCGRWSERAHQNMEVKDAGRRARRTSHRTADRIDGSRTLHRNYR